MKKLFFISCFFGSLMCLLFTVSAYAIIEISMLPADAEIDPRTEWFNKNIPYNSPLRKYDLNLEELRSVVKDIYSKSNDPANVAYALNRIDALHKVIKNYSDSKKGSLPETVRYLLKHGADPKVLDLNGNTALHKLAESQYPHKVATAKLLYDAYPESIHMVNASNESVLQAFLNPVIATRHTKEPKRSQTALAFVQFLIDKKIDLNHQDRVGSTVLHYIAGDETKNSTSYNVNNTNSQNLALAIKLLRLLMGSGADPSIKNNGDETPFHLSSQRDDLTMSELFLQNRTQGFNTAIYYLDSLASIDITPLDYAKEKKNAEMVELIKKYTPKSSFKNTKLIESGHMANNSLTRCIHTFLNRGN